MSEFAPSSSHHDSQCVNVPLGSDKELVDNFLIPKNESPSTRFNIEDRDVYRSEPWTLNWENKEVFYFARTKKSSTGKGICRKSVEGYHWKATIRKKPICNGKAWKTVLNFEPKMGSPKIFKSKWTIHEYRLQESYVERDWVLCLVKNERKKFTHCDSPAPV